MRRSKTPDNVDQQGWHEVDRLPVAWLAGCRLAWR